MPPAPISPKVKEESKPYPASSPSKPKAKSGPGRASEGEKWTPEQLWALFQGIYTRRDSVDWEKVARDVGRPVKACKNGEQNYFKHPKLQERLTGSSSKTSYKKD